VQPILFQLGPLTLYSFGVFVAVAFAAGTFVTYRLAKQRGLSAHLLFDYFLYAALAGLVGARLWHLAFRPSELSSILETFSLWGGGLALQGGLLAAGLTLWLVMRRQRQPVWQWFDVMMVGLIVGLAIGKFGSFLNGDFFGRSSSLPWAVQFNDPQAPAYVMGVKIHPLQLYAAGLYAATAAFLVRVLTKGAPARLRQLFHGHGRIFLAGLFLISLIQLLLEFLHAPIDSLYIAETVRVVSWSAAAVMLVSGVLLYRQRAASR